jgi:hypothetical protein
MDEHPGGLAADVLAGVRRAARDEDERAGGRGVELVAELEAHLALDHVQRLVLVRVGMQRRPLAGRSDGLEYGQAAPCLLAAHLEHHLSGQGVPDPPALTGSPDHRLWHSALLFPGSSPGLRQTTLDTGHDEHTHGLLTLTTGGRETSSLTRRLRGLPAIIGSPQPAQRATSKRRDR